MDFHIVDMVIVGFVLFLAIKGLVNGFSKELFNFLGLIGGITVAARTHEIVGDLITKQNILPEVAVNYQKIIGFIAVFLALWILFNLIASIVEKFSSNEIGIFSRILGYIIGVVRYGFIFALIIFGLNNAEFLKEKLQKHYEGSKLFNPMVKIGQKLLNRDLNQTIVDTNTTLTLTDTNITIVDTNATQTTTTVEEHNVSQ